MLPRRGKKKSKTESSAKPKKERPRTVRLEREDERWVDQQAHAHGFSGVVRDAVSFYRRHKEQAIEEQDRTLLEAVG